MHATIRPLALLTAAALMQGVPIGVASAQNVPAAHPTVPGLAPPSYSGPGWGPEEEEAPSANDETPTQEELPVLYITSVEVLHASAAPGMDIVRATGLASTQGWSAPLLVPTFSGKPADNILDLELIATPPDQSEKATGFVQIDAILPLQEGHPFAGVRVRGSENAITVRQIPGTAQAQINTSGCANCVGKKFAPAESASQTQSDSSSQAQQGSVREQDLPKPLRVIRAGDGIRGVEHDPNRLTLVLGDDNTIVDAFWE